MNCVVRNIFKSFVTGNTIIALHILRDCVFIKRFTRSSRSSINMTLLFLRRIAMLSRFSKVLDSSKSCLSYSTRSFASQNVQSELEGLGKMSQAIVENEERHGAHNYHPIPVALSRGKGELFIFHFE